MRILIDVAVDTVCAGVRRFEELVCLFGASHGDHFHSLPIEAVVAINGVRKHERQGITSADDQFVLVYAGPESSACMACILVVTVPEGAVKKSSNAASFVGSRMIAPIVEDYFGIGVFSLDAGRELAITQSLHHNVEKREDVACCSFTSELFSREDTIKTFMQPFHLMVVNVHEIIIYVAKPHFQPEVLNHSFF
ncbi:unnamed protein product [Schistocephalus solidus]|uniref:CPSF_A domain-containing protein n=1 Tax=Schistocephalus solidus TaxID=70667 RepID=A0A183SXK1_SCHSO|nr:unnamed protein product [Schistocephalus solidus]